MKAFIHKNKRIILNAVAVLLAILVWQAASVFINASVLIASPLMVLQRLGTLLTESGFFPVLLSSSVRMLCGFFAALFGGIVLAALAGRFTVLEILFKPWMSTIKSVPVASFIVICLIWLSSSKLSVFIAFLMAMPIIYTGILAGIKNTDPNLLACVKVFRFSIWKRFLFVYLPAVKPFLLSSCATALGFVWKAGVAAEVIGVPGDSIGEKLYYAKIYFDSADLFAWTLVIVVLSVGFEKLFLLLLKGIFRVLEKRV